MSQSLALLENVHSFPTVVSEAQPQVEELKYARNKVADVSSLTDRSAQSLVDELDIDLEAAQYLLDEYKVGGDAIYLLSSETGKAVFRVTAEDLEESPLVPRESGNMAQGGLRIKPHILADCYQTLYITEKEKEDLLLAVRKDTTDLVLESGDPSLLIYTRQGRYTIFEQIRDICTLEYLTHKSGCPVVGTASDHITAEYSIPLVDARAHNPQFDLRAAAPAALAAQLLRQIREKGQIGLHDIQLKYLDVFDKFTVYARVGFSLIT